MADNEHEDTYDPVWADVWNPEPNVWAPSTEDYPAYGEDVLVKYQSHADVPVAEPLSESYGQSPSGTTTDARANLLTDVAHPASSPPPATVIHHEVHTIEQQANVVHGRVIHVTDQVAPVVLLAPNPDRKRALIKPITTNGIIIVFPIHQGGVQGTGTIPSGQFAGYPIATGDPVHEVKSGAGVECVVANAGTPTDVAVWEEMYGPDPTAIGQGQ